MLLKSKAGETSLHPLHLNGWSEVLINHRHVAASGQQWRTVKFFADFPYEYYYENRDYSNFC
jgi:hypothetical protein